jgi:sarcosine oxidase
MKRRSMLKSMGAASLGALTYGMSDIIAQEVAEPSSVKTSYDCIVIGLGAMGSACVYQLAKRGASVLGLEQYDIAHALGSSGGISRQTKVMPYIDGPYEPLIRRANENWQSLEKDSGQKVFHQCGYLKLGVNQQLVGGEGTKLELLDESMLTDRFPQFQDLPNGTNGVLDHQGGLLRSELAIASHCHVALRHGAHIRVQEPVTDWTTDANGVTVTTSHGSYRAKHLVIAAGAWNAKVVPQLQGKLLVSRLSLGWLSPKMPGSFSVENFPIWEHGAYYGFPELPDFPGVKVAKHWGGTPSDPDNIDRTPNAADEKLLRDYLGRHFPSANGSVLAMKICMYTWGGPFLDFVPGEKRVSFIAACNGGGFKFSSAYGEALADLATEGKTDIPVGFMSIN